LTRSLPVLKDLCEHFENTIQDLKETSKAVTGTLQFIESHRAILEAESITRLTELAFLFIPLSFAASLFSMQIEQLASPVPVSHFVAFALLLSASTYTLRVITRSTWVHQQKHDILASVRTHSSLAPSAPISNSAFFAWLFAWVTPAKRVILFVVCFLTPLLTVIWTRQLDTGLKVGLTFLFLIFILYMFGIVALFIPGLRRWLRRETQIQE
jgi:hypothetical protein